MEINKSINLFAKIKIGEIDVATLTSNISNNGLNYNIGVNKINNEIIELNEENKTLYDSQYNEFVENVKQYLV
jgi:hypothetical protein